MIRAGYTPTEEARLSAAETPEARPREVTPPARAPRRARREEPSPVVDPPEERSALLSRADQARREGRFDDAIAALRSIADEHPAAPEAPSAAVSAARLEQERGRLREAAREYRRALELDPTPSLAELCYERLVSIEIALGDRERAAETAAEHRRRFPDGTRADAIEELLRRR